MAKDGAYYYDRLIHAIGAMAKLLENDSLVQLYKEQCKQMIRNFLHVGDVLGERKDMKSDDRFSRILKELYRQTFGANAVLESCCCNVEVKQDNRTVKYSWLQVAVTQSEEMIFKVIWDDLNWCLGLVSKVGEPRGYRYSTKLADMDSNLIDADKSDLKKRLEEVLAGSAAQKRDRLLASFLRARLNNEEYIFFANKCESDIVWSRKQSSNCLGKSVTATDWLGVRLARKVLEADGEFLVEREIMAPLNHPNVVRFISCSDRDGDPAILMECAETTLQEYLEQRTKKYAAQPSGMLDKASFNAGLNILEVVDIMYKIAIAVAYLHGHGFAHCDIKPSNVLVNPWKVPEFEGYVHLKIADFGVSKSGLNEGPLRDSSKQSRGTTIYRAPELLGKPKNVDFRKADVFSYALTCWHILYGKAPFADMELGTLSQELLKGTRPDIDSDVPNSLAELIRSCWDTNPQKRPTFSKVCIDLQSYKETSFLGVVPLESISVPQYKTTQRWKLFQDAYQRVKTRAIQILPSKSSGNAQQDENLEFPGDITSVCKSAIEEEQTIPGDITSVCKSASGEEQTIPGDKTSVCKSASGKGQTIPGDITSVCKSASGQTIPGPSYSFFRQSRVRGCFSRQESIEDFPPYSGPD